VVGSLICKFVKEYDYDVLLYIANWPEVRSFAYKSLLIARAIENQAFVIWLNRTGKDGNGVVHSGDSMIIDPLGKIFYASKPYITEILPVELSHRRLHENRSKFQVGLDWDEYEIK